MKTIYIVDLESVPTRYTCQWKDHVPELIRQVGGSDVRVVNISGGEESIEASPGAFLNFQQTNIYKNTQMNDIARRFTDEIQPGDKFVFTDAWNPCIIELKYMSELLGIPVEIHGLWHAGSYDPQDFLGRLIKDKRWANNFEKSLFHAIDYNWFATDFHIQLFQDNVFGRSDILWQLSDDELDTKFQRTGWPMEYMRDTLSPYRGAVKEEIIVFPHRIAPEKQPEIFRDLAESLPQYDFVFAQEENLSKDEYHKLLASSKVMFSANLQETLGISPYEGALLNVAPFVPDRLSYTEMYPDKYKYPSEWTQDWDSYIQNKQHIIKCLVRMMDKMTVTVDLADHLEKHYFSAGNLIRKLLDE